MKNSVAPIGSDDGETRKALVNNRVGVFGWRVLVIILGVTGVFIGVNGWSGLLARLTYFTIQSNALVIICLAFCVGAMLRRTASPSPFIKGAVTCYIAITGLVYNLILARVLTPEQLAMANPLMNMLLHRIVPAMAVIDWLLFDRHGRLNWGDAVVWLVYPVAYLLFALVRGAMIGAGWLTAVPKYPYPFLDVDKLGYGGIAVNFVVYGGGFLVLGLAIVWVDRRLGRVHR